MNMVSFQGDVNGPGGAFEVQIMSKLLDTRNQSVRMSHTGQRGIQTSDFE